MKKKFIFLPGDMELKIEDTSCPSNKTSHWRYAILTFPTVDIMKEMFYEVRCLKSNEDMILALAGQFKQLSHEPENLGD